MHVLHNRSAKVIEDWKVVTSARTSLKMTTLDIRPRSIPKWQDHVPGCYKLNVDASVFADSDSFTIGMVVRNHTGTFMHGKVARISGVISSFEAEVVAIDESLS